MIKFQSSKKENDDLKSKLEAKTKDFKALKELPEKKQSTDKTGQDGGPSSTETDERRIRWLKEQYPDSAHA